MPAAAPLLLIDDDDLSREILTLLFAEDGFAVAAFPSGDLALAHLVEQPEAVCWTAVLTDMQMPGTSGTALAEGLRVLVARDTPIVAMSGSPVGAAELDGFDGFLLKPLTATDLRDLLASLSPGMLEIVEKRAAGSADKHAAAPSDDPGALVPVLEEATFAEFAMLLGPVQMGEFVRLCVAEVARYTRSMQAALAAGDPAALRTAAHTLKGSVAMLGARELQAAAGRLEQGPSDAAYQRATLAEIEGAAERLRRMLVSRGLLMEGSTDATADKDTIA